MSTANVIKFPLRWNMFYKVVLLFSVMFIYGSEGGLKATCGDSGLCIPSHEQCSVPSAGICGKLWCCKKPDSGLSGLPPPSGECICVSDESFCGPKLYPFVYLQDGSNVGCSCCECVKKCSPLLLNNTLLCPTYELPVGSCENSRSWNRYCCQTDLSTDPPSMMQCQCRKCCPNHWKEMGVCMKCCLPRF